MGLLGRLFARPQSAPAAPPSAPAVGKPLFAVVDVETTGLSPRYSRVLELGVVLADGAGRPVQEWSSRFDPQGPVGATHIHGISAEDLIGAPLFADLVPQVVQLLAGRVVVTHNAGFDLGFLRSEFERAGWDLPSVPSLCTMEASRWYLPHLPRHRLGDCCAACGVTLRDAHSALGDARATTGVLATYLGSAPDRGAWLQCDVAAAAAADLVWPTTPTRHPDPVRVDRRARAFARMAHPTTTPPLLAAVRGMDFTDVLDEGAPSACLPYLELVASALEDGVLDPQESAALADLVVALGLKDEDVTAAHRAFLRVLAGAALADGRVSRDETAQLNQVADLLSLDTALVGTLVQQAEASRHERLSQGLRPLPEGWSLGEPLRVGDKVVFTGCEAFHRDALEQRCTRLGVKVVGSVSRRTTLLVADGTMDGGKAAEARRLGTRVVHPRDLVTLLDHLQPAAAPTATTPTSTPAPEPEPAETAAPTGASSPVSPSVIRAWARLNGYPVADRGRLHADIVEAYHQAHRA